MIKQLKNCSISNISKKVMQLVFLLPFTAILAYAIIGSSNYFFLIIVALLIFFTVLTRFTIALIMIGLASYFLTYTIWYFNLPKPLTNLGYVLIVMVLIREYFFTANMLPVRIPINRILFFILALGFLSIAGGEATAYASFKGMLKHIGFPLLFILILMAEPDEKLMRQLVIAIIVVAFIQVAASIWQFTWYSTISPKPGGMRADRS